MIKEGAAPAQHGLTSNDVASAAHTNGRNGMAQRVGTNGRLCRMVRSSKPDNKRRELNRTF